MYLLLDETVYQQLLARTAARHSMTPQEVEAGFQDSIEALMKRTDSDAMELKAVL